MNQELKVLSGIGLVTVAILASAVFFLSKPQTQNPEVSEVRIEPTLLVKDYNHKIGTDSAKIKIVEFADFQCPACGIAYPFVKKILEEYKSDIYYVYRHYPLPQHKFAFLAAQAAEAAGEQGQFFEYYDKLFQNQKTWAESPNPKQLFITYAQELGLDINKFSQDLDSSKFDSRINQDISGGNSLGVNATPTFFINGQKYTGGIGYQDLKSYIEPLLK